MKRLIAFVGIVAAGMCWLMFPSNSNAQQYYQRTVNVPVKTYEWKRVPVKTYQWQRVPVQKEGWQRVPVIKNVPKKITYYQPPPIVVEDRPPLLRSAPPRYLYTRPQPQRYFTGPSRVTERWTGFLPWRKFERTYSR